MVSAFNNTIVLRGIIYNEFLLCSSKLKIWLKFCRYVYSLSLSEWRSLIHMLYYVLHIMLKVFYDPRTSDLLMRKLMWVHCK